MLRYRGLQRACLHACVSSPSALMVVRPSCFRPPFGRRRPWRCSRLPPTQSACVLQKPLPPVPCLLLCPLRPALSSLPRPPGPFYPLLPLCTLAGVSSVCVNSLALARPILWFAYYCLPPSGLTYWLGCPRLISPLPLSTELFQEGDVPIPRAGLPALHNSSVN